MKAIIPAAGFGTRFLPWTKACPKEMLPILDKPTIHWTVEEILKSGISEIIIVISQGKEAIVEYFSPNPSLKSFLKKQGKEDRLKELDDLLDKVSISFVYQKGSYGNASPVLSARAQISDSEPFLVVWGDEFIISKPPWLRQLVSVFDKYKKPVVSAIKVTKDEIPTKGIAKLKKFKIRENLFELTDLIEKPAVSEAPSDIAVIGAYLFTPEIWPILEKIQKGRDGELWLTDALKIMIKNQPVLAKVINHDRFWDVGVKEKYYQIWRDINEDK